MRKGIIIVLLLISVSIIPFVIFSLQFFAVTPTDDGGGGEYGDYTPSTEYNIIESTLESIEPSTEGGIRLDWDDAEVLNSDLSDLMLSYYRVLRRKDDGAWIQITLVHNVEYFIDHEELAGGTYGYKIQTALYETIYIEEEHLPIRVEHYSDYSNIQSVVFGFFPTNPSISINDGAETTNSFEVTLTLSCDNADEMHFQITEEWWTNWTAYSNTYIITLFENDPYYPDYRVGVVFRNVKGTTEDAYGDIYDDIIYDPEGEPPPVPPEEEIDYTLLYVLLGVLVGLVGIVVFLKYRKQIIKSK